MKDRITKPRAAAILGAVILLFGAFNLGLYRLFTVRLGTNYSDTSQVKMVDVQRYLPFESGSELIKADTTFRLTDEDRKSTRLNSSHPTTSRMPSSA